MSNIFNSIQSVHNQLTGWCSWEKAQTLAAAVLAFRPATIVEIGVWGGKSLIPMAMAQQTYESEGDVVTYAIDPWTADASKLGQLNQADAEWWADQSKHDYAYNAFLKAIDLTQLNDIVEVIKLPADEVPSPESIGLLHCDGNHGEQALRDISKFAPNVLHGGIVVLDDLQWTGGAVKESEGILMKLGFSQLYLVNDHTNKNQWAVYQRA